MKRIWKLWSVTLFCVSWSSSSLAEQSPPVAIRVLNLGSQSINAFTIVGFPFRTIGLDARPGESLTPSFGDEQMTYELYWRLKDRSVYAAVIDLRKELPASFYGNALISIHDDHAAVSWSNVDPAWVEYRRVGDESKVPKPGVPLYLGCSGVVFSDPIALRAWNESVEKVRSRMGPRRVEEEILSGSCTLEWYVAHPAPRQRDDFDEATTIRLRGEWQADIEKYRAAHPATR